MQIFFYFHVIDKDAFNYEFLQNELIFYFFALFAGQNKKTTLKCDIFWMLLFMSVRYDGLRCVYGTRVFSGEWGIFLGVSCWPTTCWFGLLLFLIKTVGNPWKISNKNRWKSMENFQIKTVGNPGKISNKNRWKSMENFQIKTVGNPWKIFK